MPSTATRRQINGIEMLMEAKAQTVRRIESDPAERRVLVQMLAGLKELQVRHNRLGEQIDRHVAMAAWLLEFDGQENRDHDGADNSIKEASRIFDGQKANRSEGNLAAQAS